MSESTLDNLLHEDRTFPPSPEFAAQANVTAAAFDEAAADRLAFWDKQAQLLDWGQPWTQTLDWSNAPFAKWFVDGTLNVSLNCVDRHVDSGNGDKVAIHFEGEPGDTRTITYRDLQTEVSKAANALTELGVTADERVTIYMPMIPEAVFAMLACARLGAMHSVVFGGFSADALRSRIEDAHSRFVITADGGFRRGAPAALKPAVDEATAELDYVEKIVVVKRTNQEVEWTDRDVWWHELVDAASAEHTPELFDAEQPLFLLYTSGTTGSPKGIKHTSGGYLTQCLYTFNAVFDYKPDDVYWCTADIGWVTGHSYVVYGPLAAGATVVLYEGTPDSPHKGRWWELIEKYQVSILYTAPTAIRTFAKWGREIPEQFDLSSLRMLGSVGEPINPEAWMWYRHVIGGDRCPIVDTWWQTETGAAMISPLPGVTACKPGSAMRPLPGINVEIVNDAGEALEWGQGGYLAIAEPWPSMLRGIWGDDERFIDTYWSRWPGIYFAGDGAKYEDDGTIWLLGRVDDVMNVSGHRISTTEVESALVSYDGVAEAAVVGADDETSGQAIVGFVILEGTTEVTPSLVDDLRTHVSHEIGPIAKPKRIMIVDELPKTRSGKIMRRLLRDVAENRTLGDTTTLADPAVMALIRTGMDEASDED